MSKPMWSNTSGCSATSVFFAGWSRTPENENDEDQSQARFDPDEVDRTAQSQVIRWLAADHKLTYGM